METREIMFILKPEWLTTINKVSELYDQKIEQLRQEGNDLGKYLIGISDKPWDSVEFKIGSEKDYRNSSKRRSVNEIIMGEKI